MRLTPPFNKTYQLENRKATTGSPPLPSPSNRLPGNPRIDLGSPHAQLISFLTADLTTPQLNSLAPRMWLMTTQSSSNISPLTHQSVKGRTIVLTEDPRLHLVWIDD